MLWTKGTIVRGGLLMVSKVVCHLSSAIYFVGHIETAKFSHSLKYGVEGNLL